MNNLSGWIRRTFAAALFALCFTPSVHGADFALTMTTASNSVSAGGQVSLWLNVLNPTSSDISWTFPATIDRKIISARGTFTGSLTLHSAESNAVVIAPGAFARREYVTTVPASATGQIVLEFSGLNVNRTVLEVQTAGTMSVTAGKTGSAFNRFISQVEPETPDKGNEPGSFFKEHISGYEPMYFIAGTKSPNAKFQVSFAYQLLNNEGALAENVPLLKGFHLAYTQVSLWDWNAASSPFYDTTYKPELFYAWNNLTHAKPSDWIQLDLQGGLQHASNGKDGLSSRSMNIAYLRPTLTVGPDDGLQLTLQPRVWAYLGDLSDNPDIADYRGYADLRMVLGWKRGLQLSALGQLGRDGNHGSLQLDLTYPTMRFFGSFSLYLDVQYFTGYGDSLLGYNQKSDQLRVGVALFR